MRAVIGSSAVDCLRWTRCGVAWMVLVAFQQVRALQVGLRQAIRQDAEAQVALDF